MKTLMVVMASFFIGNAYAGSFSNGEIHCDYANSEQELVWGTQQAQQKEIQISQWLLEFKGNCLTAKDDSLQKTFCNKLQQAQRQEQRCRQLLSEFRRVNH